MFRYIIKRILMMIPVLLGVSFVVYYLMDLAPGDIIGADGAAGCNSGTNRDDARGARDERLGF